MTKRLLSAYSSEIAALAGAELKQAILASEGRIIVGETVVTAAPLLAGVSNAEVMRAFAADMVILNEYDVNTRFVSGLENCSNPIAYFKELTSMPLGINLEPVDAQVGCASAMEAMGTVPGPEELRLMSDLITLPPGRQVSRETLQAAEKQGADFICLTGNPGTGVSNSSLKAAVKLAKQYFSGLVFVGKMHAAGLAEKVVDEQAVLDFVDAGADVILLPAAGTVPGVGEAELTALVRKIKAKGALTMAVVGTSQESADAQTIREIALANKRCGFDIHHLGDGSFGRMPDPENLLTLSLAIRGKRHTYFRMSQSLRR